jgi:type II secretory pathway component GspD/PulD (secretin)
MFKLILLLFTSISLFAQSISLADFAFIVQKKDNVDIIFSNDVSKTLLVDFPSDYSKSTYMPLFKTILSANNLSIHDDNGIMVVSPKIDNQTLTPDQLNNHSLLAPPALVNQSSQSLSVPLPPPNDYNISFVSHKLEYLQFDNVKSLLDFSTLPYSFSTVSKTITFKDNGKNSKLIKKLIKEIAEQDIKKDQVTLKITIFDTNLNKLKEVGINPSLNFDFSLLSQTGALLSGSSVGLFKGSLSFLQNSGATKIITSSPFLISDNEKLDVKKTVSIPFLDENYVVTAVTGSTNQSKKYKYRDIGFTVTAIPTIVGDVVYLDFSLNVGGVISSGDLPTTSQTSISNKFSVKKGEIVLLAGISKNSIINKKDTLPFIESIPILSDIFTKKSDSDTDETFNVSIEIL